MPTTTVTIHLPGRTVPATLSTDHSASTYGVPVLVMEGGPSFAEGQEVSHGVGDVTTYGLAACLLLDTEPGEGEPLLERWQEAARGYREREGLPTLAEAWLDAGGWTDGSEWHQGDRSLTEELDATPSVERERVRHVDHDGDPAETTAWTFPDGSGVVAWGLDTHGATVGGDRMLVATWDAFDVEGRTETGHVVREGWEERPPVFLRTRLPEERKVEGLDYGAHLSRPGWDGYYVRPEGTERYAIARLTPASDETYETDAEIAAAIRAELAGGEERDVFDAVEDVREGVDR